MELLFFNIFNEVPVIIPFTIALVSSLVLTFIVMKVARKAKWVAFPRSDRWHSKPVALMGGVAIYISASVAVFFAAGTGLFSIWLGGTLMFLLGFWDDSYEIKPVFKFIIQMIAASLLIGSGYLLGGGEWPFLISYPLTFLWIIGLTNAINLLDNMDGLAAGVVFIIAVLLGLFGVKFSNYLVTVYSFTLAAASAGFLFYNYNPAKIFMGDCGSLFLGYSLAGLALALNPPAVTEQISLLFAITVIMALPIFDTTLVTLARVFNGRSISKGGKDHLSHRLVTVGLSDRQSVIILYFIAGYLGFISLFLFPQQLQLFYVTIAIGAVIMFILGRYLIQVDVYPQTHLSSLRKKVGNIPDYLKTRFQLATIIIDITLIISSLILAHYIRFEGWSNNIETAVVNIVLGAIVIKVSLIALFGLYKSVWRHAGVADLARIFSASFTGAIATGIFAWIYLASYPSWTVFVIDGFLFFFMLSASRFAVKGFRRLFALSGKSGKNVLLYGAGDAGWLALSEIRQNKNIRLNPVGFIDDNPYKTSGNIQGIKVLGNFNDLYQLINEKAIEEVLICAKNISGQKEIEISNICTECSITCKKFEPSFSDFKVEAPKVKSILRRTQNM